MQNNAGTNKLKQVIDPKIIFSMISSCKDKEGKIFAWKLVGNTKVMANLRFRVIRKFKNELCFYPEEGQAEELKKIIAGTDSVNIFFQEDCVLMQTKLKYLTSENELVVEFPKMLAQVERRKNFRLILGDSANAKVEFYKSIATQRIQTQFFKKELYDLSAGGFSLIITKLEKKFFEKGDEVSDIQINFEGKFHNLCGEIVNLLSIEPNEFNKLSYKGYKVCVKFDQIDTNAKGDIDSFVFKHLDFDKAI